MVKLASPSCRCVTQLFRAIPLLTTGMTIALTFVLAPLPNALSASCGGDEFSADYDGPARGDLARFITSIFVVTGFAFPLVLAHSEVIRPGACAMSIIGGGYVSVSNTAVLKLSHAPRLVYGTILAYSAAFRQEDSEFD